MFSFKKREPATLDGFDNVVWFGRKQDKKREVTQWVDWAFYEIWEKAMQDAFDVLGMMDRFKSILKEEADVGIATDGGLGPLLPVPGHKNRDLLRKATSNIDEVTTRFERIPVGDGTVIRYNGDKAEALEQWRAIAEILGHTTVVAIVTPGLLYYVQGTQVGYSPSTRHMFRRSNTVERLGLPNEPRWCANVSGYVITIIGDWDEIKKTRKETGYTIFRMLQLRLNEGLEAAIKKEE